MTVTALEAGTNRFTSIGSPTYTNGLTGSVSSNVITITSTASTITGSNAQVTIPVNYTDSEGTSGTKNVVATVSKALASAPAVVVSIEKDGQTITKNNSNSYSNPSSFKLYVAEGGSAYVYDATSPIVNSTFQITNVTNGSVTATDGNSFATISPNTPASTSGLLISITGSYLDSEGTSTTFYKTHNVNVASDGTNGATGAAGPGIVLRGEYAAGTTYYYTTYAGSSRRDAVYQSSGGVTKYYATLQQTTGNAPTDGSSNSYWEYLGTQDFFVAAKIAIFDESYVKNTLNVGTNSAGSAANITLAGGTTSPYVSIGQSTQGYGNDGIWLGITNASTPKVSFSKGSNYFKYDANATNIVDIGGRISATSLTAQTGSIGGFEIQSNILQGGTSTNGVRLDGGNSLIIAGNASGNSSARISAAGFFAGNTSFGSAPFRVNTDGYLIATSADIRGKITATDGTIGGWSINDTSIFKDRITLYAGAGTNYIQITGDAAGSFAGNRVYIHPGSLSSLTGGGASIAAINPSSYLDITSANTIYSGNSSTTATIGTSSQTVSSLSSSSTYNIISKLKFKIDLQYTSVSVNSTYNASYTGYSMQNQFGNIGYYTKYTLGYGSPNFQLPLIDRGWIAGYGPIVENFISAYNSAKGTSYGSLYDMYVNNASPWTVATAFSGVNGSIGVTAAMTFNGVTQTSAYTFTPTSEVSSAESSELVFNINAAGNGTTGPSFSINKTNTLTSLYKKITWTVGYYNYDFEGNNYSGYAVWASSGGYDSYSPTSLTYSAKAISLTASALTKQVELSEAGMQAVFNAVDSAAGNYFRVEDIGTPSTTNFNIKSAGYFAHYGEMHVKGDIAGFSTALSSDRRLKKDIVDIEEDEINDIDKLHPVTYSWKDDDSNKKHYGFIAQDVQKIYPHLTETKIMGEYLTINYNELIPVMVKQIQNLKKEVDTLKMVVSNGK